MFRGERADSKPRLHLCLPQKAYLCHMRSNSQRLRLAPLLFLHDAEIIEEVLQASDQTHANDRPAHAHDNSAHADDRPAHAVEPDYRGSPLIRPESFPAKASRHRASPAKARPGRGSPQRGVPRGEPPPWVSSQPQHLPAGRDRQVGNPFALFSASQPHGKQCSFLHKSTCRQIDRLIDR